MNVNECVHEDFFYTTFMVLKFRLRLLRGVIYNTDTLPSRVLRLNFGKIYQGL